MPQLIPLAVAAYGPAAGWTAATTMLAVTAASVAVGAYQQRQAERDAERALRETRRNQTIMVRSATEPRKIVYGRSVISGPMALAESTGEASNRLHIVIPLCEGPIDAVEEVYLNDEPVGMSSLDASGWSTRPTFLTSRSTATEISTTVNAQGSWSVTVPAYATVTTVYRYESDDSQAVVWWTQQGTTVTGSDTLTPGTQIRVIYWGGDESAVGKHVRVRVALGNSDQTADQVLMSEVGATWTSEHRLRGVAYLYVTLVRNQNIFPTGLPNIKARVRGAKVYDPRKDSTLGGSGGHRADNPSTWEWSQNLALCIRDYLTRADGLGIPAADLPASNWIAAAQTCDELVVSAGYGEAPLWGVPASVRNTTTEPRYTCNGVVDLGAEPGSILGSLCCDQVHSLVESEGQWRFYPAAYTFPTLTLTESDFAGFVNVQAATSRSDLFNGVRGVYNAADAGYLAKSFPAYKSASYATEDGAELMRDVQFNFVSSPSEAQRLARVLVERGRRSLTVQADFNLKQAFRLQAGDTVRLTLARFGFSSKVFRVVSWEWMIPNTIRMTLREEDSAQYSWTTVDAADTPPPKASNLPNPFYRPVVGTPAVFSGQTYSRMGPDGVAVQAMFVQWPPIDVSTVTQGGRFEIEYKRVSDDEFTSAAPSPGDATSTIIEPVNVGSIYLIRICAVTSLNVRGDWVYVAHYVTGPSSEIGSGTLTAGVSANQLANSAMLTGVEKYETWDLVAATAGGWTVGTSHDGYRPRPFGSIYRRWSSAQSSGSVYGRITPPGIVPVAPGMRLEASIYANMIRCKGSLNVAWFNSQNQYIGEQNAFGGVGTVANNALAPLGNLSGFTRLWGFATVPGTVVGGTASNGDQVPSFAKLNFFAEGIGQADAVMYGALPFLGYAKPAQDEPSPWNNGASIGAAAHYDEITKTYNSGSIPDLEVTGSPYWGMRNVIAFVPDASGRVSITITFQLVGQSQGNAYIIEGYINPTAGLSPGTVQPRALMQVPISTAGFVTRTVTITESFTCTVGVPVTISLFLSRRTNVITKEIPPPTPPAGYDQASAISATAVVLKL